MDTIFFTVSVVELKFELLGCKHLYCWHFEILSLHDKLDHMLKAPLLEKYMRKSYQYTGNFIVSQRLKCRGKEINYKNDTTVSERFTTQ